MTDNEIIKALECCIRPAGQQSCFDCPLVKRQGCCSTFLIQNAFDLINHQKAEIEMLKHRKTELQIRNQELQHEKSEAIKEFAERLKIRFAGTISCNYGTINRAIDNIVKEMTKSPNKIKHNSLCETETYKEGE